MALRDQCADAGVPFFMKQMTAEEVDSRSANGAPIPQRRELDHVHRSHRQHRHVSELTHEQLYRWRLRRWLPERYGEVCRILIRGGEAKARPCQAVELGDCRHRAAEFVRDFLEDRFPRIFCRLSEQSGVWVSGRDRIPG